MQNTYTVIGTQPSSNFLKIG